MIKMKSIYQQVPQEVSHPIDPNDTKIVSSKPHESKKVFRCIIIIFARVLPISTIPYSLPQRSILSLHRHQASQAQKINLA